MCIRDSSYRDVSFKGTRYLLKDTLSNNGETIINFNGTNYTCEKIRRNFTQTTYRDTVITQTSNICLLYTSDAADERSSVDLGGRRIIKKKNKKKDKGAHTNETYIKNDRAYLILEHMIKTKYIRSVHTRQTRRKSVAKQRDRERN